MKYRRLAILLCALLSINICLADREPVWIFTLIVPDLSGSEWDNDRTLLTVPENKTFIVDYFIITGDYEHTSIYIDSDLLFTHLSEVYPIYGAVKITAGQSLIAIKPLQGSGTTYIQVSGYYEFDCPTADLNDDCKVDMQDLAVFAANWLK